MIKIPLFLLKALWLTSIFQKYGRANALEEEFVTIFSPAYKTYHLAMSSDLQRILMIMDAI